MNEKTGSVDDWFMAKSIENGCIYLKDKRVVKILEVIPINFRLKTEQEQNAILYQYQVFLKSINCDIQIAVQTKPADVSKYKEKYIDIYSKERNEKMKEMLLDYVELISSFSSNKTISRKFFIIIFLKENQINNSKNEVVQELNKKIIHIKENLFKCGNRVYELSDYECEKLIYSYLNKNSSQFEKIDEKFNVKQVIF